MKVWCGGKASGLFDSGVQGSSVGRMENVL